MRHVILDLVFCTMMPTAEDRQHRAPGQSTTLHRTAMYIRNMEPWSLADDGAVTALRSGAGARLRGAGPVRRHGHVRRQRQHEGADVSACNTFLTHAEEWSDLCAVLDIRTCDRHEHAHSGRLTLTASHFSPPLQFAEKGTRIDDLKAIIERVTSVTTLFDRCAPGAQDCPSSACKPGLVPERGLLPSTYRPADCRPRPPEWGASTVMRSSSESPSACPSSACADTLNWLPCSDGISLRAMNLPDQRDGVADSAQAAAYVQQLK